MSFKLIREAQARLRMDDQQLTLAHHVSSILKQNVLGEAFNPSDFEVTPDHYNQWLATIRDIATERGMNLNKRMEFNEIAFDILDNDSLIDALGGDSEKTKENIVKILWQSHQVNKAHQKVSQHVGDTIQRTREEEEMVDQLVGAEEEQGGFAQAFKTAQGTEEEEQMFRRHVGPRTVYQHAVAKPTRTNPYPAGSLRASIWDDMHPSSSSEEEEFDAKTGESEYDSDMSGSNDGDEFDHHADVGGEEALEQRVDDLESRVAGLEDDTETDDGEMGIDDTGSEVLPDEEFDHAPSRDVPVRDSVRAEPRSQVVDKNFDEEEQVKSMFHKAITSPKEHLSAALRGVEDEGLKAWSTIAMPRNPHPKDSPAHKAWAKGFKNAAKNGLGFADKPRETTSKLKPRKK